MEEITRYGLKAYTLVFPIVGFQIVSSIYFQAVGKPRMSFFYKSFKTDYSYDTLFNNFTNIFWLKWYLVCSTNSDSIATLITFILVRKEIKKLDKLEEMLEKRKCLKERGKCRN